MAFDSRSFLALWLCLLGTLANAGERGYATDLDSTDDTKYSIQLRGTPTPLRRLQDHYNYGYWLHGAFRGSRDLTAGNDLHIFPNGRFVLTSWCDICAIAPLLIGSWSRSGNLVQLHVEKRIDDAQLLHGHKALQRRYGDVTQLAFFVTARGEFIGDSVLVPTPESGDAAAERFFVRREAYHDWERIYKAFESAASKFR